MRLCDVVRLKAIKELRNSGLVIDMTNNRILKVIEDHQDHYFNPIELILNLIKKGNKFEFIEEIINFACIYGDIGICYDGRDGDDTYDCHLEFIDDIVRRLYFKDQTRIPLVDNSIECITSLNLGNKLPIFSEIFGARYVSFLALLGNITYDTAFELFLSQAYLETAYSTIDKIVPSQKHMDLLIRSDGHLNYAKFFSAGDIESNDIDFLAESINEGQYNSVESINNIIKQRLNNDNFPVLDNSFSKILDVLLGHLIFPSEEQLYNMHRFGHKFTDNQLISLNFDLQFNKLVYEFWRLNYKLPKGIKYALSNIEKRMLKYTLFCMSATIMSVKELNAISIALDIKYDSECVRLLCSLSTVNKHMMDIFKYLVTDCGINPTKSDIMTLMNKICTKPTTRNNVLNVLDIALK